MAKAEASVEELVGMIERGELRLPEMQRRYVWRSTRVRDLLDSLYRGYPSGAILLWETDEEVPLQEMAVTQQSNPYQSTRLLLDGQQRLTSLSAVIRGESVKVRGRKKPVELLFNLDHPDQLTVGGPRLEALQGGWKESCRGMEFAINFLKSNAGIDSPALLSSPFILIALAYHGHKRDYALSAEESDRLRYWALVANAKGRYSRVQRDDSRPGSR